MMNILGMLGIITTNLIMSNKRQKKKIFEVEGKNSVHTEVTSKKHKTRLIAYNMEMKLKRIRLAYDGDFYYMCEDSKGRHWTLQSHEVTEWI